ncbi:hypothetical protein [Streptomyces sp.]|uniref:hypothetical protein n=1 Tax=Streptomyces sp. TaxID=1931 RepID=UPI002C3316B8|nr:hypothetical protein [Streptomyces sp.]HLL32674.1 hypothetical protein [Streptomyces sp.]HZF87218.1 hypothetical protein [Streptomyces sp.]
MPGHRRTRSTLTASAAAAVLVLTGCTGEDSPENRVGDAASAVESAASRAGDSVASATAEADRRFDDITGGLDAKSDVRLGRPATGRDDRTTVEVTVRNTAGSAKSFAVQINFTRANGDLLDTAVVKVDGVPAAGERSATARSNRSLDGDVRAEVARAVRY